MRRLLRTLLFTAITLTAWLVALPAWASAGVGAGAGLCSQRGTSEVAPPPIFMPSEASLEQGDDAFGCDGEWTQHAVQPSQERIEWSASSIDVTLPRSVRIGPPAMTHVGVHGDRERGPDGVAFTVERPPR